MRDFHSILPACAVAVGVALVTVTSAFTEAPKNAKNSQLFYEFNTTANYNDADDISNWIPITQTEYENSSCNQNERACMLEATTAPSSVPYIQKTDYKKPVADGVVILEVKNRSAE